MSVSVDEDKMVPFLIQVKQNGELARRLAERCNLPGADNLFVQAFNEKFGMGQYQEAAKIAAKAPKVNKNVLFIELGILFLLRKSPERLAYNS